MDDFGNDFNDDFESSSDSNFDSDFDSDGTTDIFNTSRNVISLKKIIVGVIGGAAGFLVGKIIYNALIETLWKPLVIAMFVAVVSIFVFAFIRAAAISCGDTDRLYRTGSKKSQFNQMACIGIIVLFLVSGLFEFIYELSFSKKNNEPTSYIIALDTSGSMESTDSTHQLSKAMVEIVADMEDGFPYAVYTFDGNVSCISDMHRKNADDEALTWDLNYSGGTAMSEAMKVMFDDYKSDVSNGSWQGGENVKVIILSDGDPSDGGFLNSNIDKNLKKYRKNNISISTVAVDGADIGLMQDIADSTGGVCISINDVEKLAETIGAAMNSYAERTLFTYRSGIRMNVLYAIMRIIFLALIGCIFFMPIYYGNAVERDLNGILTSKIVTGLAGGLIVEFVMQSTNISETLIMAVFCILASIAPLYTVEVPKPSGISETDTGSDWGYNPETDWNTLDDENKKNEKRKDLGE